jgi:hypothetical protein
MREELLKEYAEEALKNGPHRFIRPDDKIFYMDGFKDGYNLGLKSKINKTTISDAPAIPTPEIKCNECGKLCTPSGMTDDRWMCKDCYIKWLEGQYKELTEQIEKMKCCFNCRHSRTEYEHCRTDKHEKWEIKEK